MGPVVALDTNALMMPVECDVRVFEELDRLFGSVEVLTTRSAIRELERLAEGGGTEAVAASVGLDLARERCQVVEDDEQYADDVLLGLAREGDAEYVVTNDGPLRTRLLRAGVPVIALRGRNELAITQP
ncbi:PIN domain-containing protein [Natronorarus salvus]|uniref:PIN domain-containing protein n=1 Tax=Natronorarus salvus TaxID=3117733 RepID=UPI003907F164